MTNFPKAITRLPASLIHILALPVSFMAAALMYEPKALGVLMGSGSDFTQIDNLHSFNIVICFAIILVVVAIFRMTLWLTRKHFPADLWRYSFFCISEMLVCCAFTGMYLVLMDHGAAGGYFNYFGRSVSSIGSMMIMPYVILTLLYMALEKPQAISPDSDIRLKFYDGRHQLKFITEASSVLYIESNENYIIIHYLENGVEKKMQIRNSMKNIEPLCEQAGFARTHRCFIVNPAHVKLIRREQGGMNTADLGIGEGIPISKKYYDSIAAIL